MNPKNPADKTAQPKIHRAGQAESWAAKKSNLVQAAGRAVPPGTDARVAFGFAPMSLKGAAYHWRGLGDEVDDAPEPLPRDGNQSGRS
jgi:hypothetical protein